MNATDVLIVGGGPAGSATASLLAARGLRVTVVDRATFPRPKPCAEYLSPETARPLDRLGVLDAVLACGPARLRGMRIVSPDGTSFTGRFDAATGHRPYRDHGLALPRERLDAILFARAAAAGAEVREATRCHDFTVEEGGVRVRLRRTGGGDDVVMARFVVGADGLHSRVASRLGLARRGRRRWLALTTHARDVSGMADVGEMHVTRGAYVGLAPVGHGITNVAGVVRLGDEPAAPPAVWLDRIVSRLPEVRDRLAGARRTAPVRAAGPFDHTTRRATADRMLLVGDAADFYDPFTGEGLYAGLRGAELAAARIEDALATGRVGARHLAPYDRDRLRTFGGKWAVERLVGAAVSRPALLDHAARRLARRPALAHLLIGVTGDFVPPRRVLHPGFLWRLVA